MNAYIVTQVDADAELLRRVLPQDVLEEVGFVPAGRHSAVMSMARSLIAQRRVLLAVVLDADTTAPRLIHEQRQSAEEVIGMVSPSVPFKVILAVPTLAEELPSAPQPSEAPAIRELADFLRRAQELAAPALSLAGNA